jgi:hypothetical protein
MDDIRVRRWRVSNRIVPFVVAIRTSVREKLHVESDIAKLMLHPSIKVLLIVEVCMVIWIVKYNLKIPFEVINQGGKIHLFDVTDLGVK